MPSLLNEKCNPIRNPAHVEYSSAAWCHSLQTLPTSKIEAKGMKGSASDIADTVIGRRVILVTQNLVD